MAAVAEFVEGFVDIHAADWLEEMDVVQEEEEELQKARNQDEDAFGPLEKMHQEMELIMAWELRCQGSFPHFGLQMAPELLGLRVVQNYQACDQLMQDFAHHNLETVHSAIKYRTSITVY